MRTGFNPDAPSLAAVRWAEFRNYFRFPNFKGPVGKRVKAMYRSQDNSRHWRDRAQKMRRLAETMGYPHIARLLFDLVNDYEKRAEQAARHGAINSSVSDANRANLARTFFRSARMYDRRFHHQH